MPRPRSAMRKIRDVLRLSWGAGLSRRQVGAAVGLPYTTIADHLGRARAAGLSWPLPEGMDDGALEARLFSSASGAAPRPMRPLPDWAVVHRELRRKGVTLQLLWLEYREAHPDGYQYTQFCDLYRRWQRHLDVVLRQEHRAGERLFVDFPGQTVPVVDPATGVVLQAELFVAVLGASNYTYAEAFPSQALPHWIAGHVHAFEYFSGCPQLLVCDNLRAGVTRAHRYAPEVNRTYQELAAHYGCAVLPARPRKPRDKAKVEAGVLLVERWILARLRQRTFGSLVALNGAIRALLDWLNDRPFKKVPGSRRSLFEALDRPALRPLPAQRYVVATWQTATVPPDYHVAVDRHWYSVPSRLTGQRCEVRLTATTVEVFWRGHRVASHLRSNQPGGQTTDPVHRPESHRRHLECTPDQVLRWAAQTGPATTAVVASLLHAWPHLAPGLRAGVGLVRLGRRYGAARLEAACRRALALHAPSYRSVESILRTGLDRQPLPAPTPAPAWPRRAHANVRGAPYYH